MEKSHPVQGKAYGWMGSLTCRCVSWQLTLSLASDPCISNEVRHIRVHCPPCALPRSVSGFCLAAAVADIRTVKSKCAVWLFFCRVVMSSVRHSWAAAWMQRVPQNQAPAQVRSISRILHSCLMSYITHSTEMDSKPNNTGLNLMQVPATDPTLAYLPCLGKP